MSENAIDVRAAASAAEQAIAEPPALSLARGPGALRITLLMARVTFREAARRKILWIATLAGVGFLAFFWTALHYRSQECDAADLPPSNFAKALS